MITAKMIEVSTVRELEHEVARIDDKINENQREINRLEFAKNDLKIAICEKDGGHDFKLECKNHPGFEIYKCKCGAIQQG